MKNELLFALKNYFLPLLVVFALTVLILSFVI